MAGGHLVAVSAAAVQLAEIRDGEVVDDDGATAIVLDHLVLGTCGSTAVDRGGLVVALLLNTEGVFTDGLPPDIVDGTAALAMNTLDLVGAYNISKCFLGKPGL